MRLEWANHRTWGCLRFGLDQGLKSWGHLVSWHVVHWNIFLLPETCRNKQEHFITSFVVMEHESMVLQVRGWPLKPFLEHNCWQPLLLMCNAGLNLLMIVNVMSNLQVTWVVQTHHIWPRLEPGLRNILWSGWESLGWPSSDSHSDAPQSPCTTQVIHFYSMQKYLYLWT